MKLIFTEVKGNRASLDIENGTSIEQVKEILINNHKFSKGKYVFIRNGKILPAGSKFIGYKENEIIVIYIKDKIDADSFDYSEEYFWEHPLEASEWAQIQTTDRDIGSVLLHYDGILEDEGQEIDALLLSGVIINQERPTMPDIEAEIQSMSNAQRQGFKRVVDSCRTDPETAIQTYAACDYDPETTIACLRSM